MKRIILILILMAAPAMAMDWETPVVYNALNLTQQQQQAKAEIDARREYELDAGTGNVKKINKKYDKEVDKLLTKQQKNKLHAVRRLSQKNVKFKQDPNLKPFGVKP
jgi:hypothetical protein